MEFLKLFERHEDYESASTKPMYAHCINDVEMHVYEAKIEKFDYMHLDGTVDKIKGDDVIGICILTEEENIYNNHGPIFVFLGEANDRFANGTFSIDSATTTTNDGFNNTINLANSTAYTFSAARTCRDLIVDLYASAEVSDPERMASESNAAPYLPSPEEFKVFFDNDDLLEQLNDIISTFGRIYYNDHPILDPSQLTSNQHWMSSVNKWNNPSYMTPGESSATYPGGSAAIVSNKKIRPFLHIKGYLGGGENIQTPQEPAL